MHYSKFTIKNYRCFGKQQILSFAEPIEGTVGSGITYIVGPNNSGKTTIIEGIQIKNRDFLDDSARRKKTPEFKWFIGKELQTTVGLIRESSSSITETPKARTESEIFEFVSSRRGWASEANSGGNNEIFLLSTKREDVRKNSSLPVASILKNIELDEGQYNKFVELVKRVIPEFYSWSVGNEKGLYIKYKTKGGIEHRTDFLGDGVISVIRILTHLFQGNPNGLVIDEPELSLHPQAQKNLLEVIAEYSAKRQIVLSTHSPYFINWEYIKNGAKLNRVTKIDDKDSKIATLKKANSYTFPNGANWQQPFLFDEVAKEIFFHDNILFVEGQEDVGLIRKFYAEKLEGKKIPFHIYGYGVRGIKNFETACKFAKDLGLQNVAVLIDDGEEEQTIYETLRENYPNYKIVKLDEHDIRDKKCSCCNGKKENCRNNKKGYFNVKGGIKKDRCVAFKAIFDEIAEYFPDKMASSAIE